jgi:hypothetical protein
MIKMNYFNKNLNYFKFVFSYDHATSNGTNSKIAGGIGWYELI